MYQPHKSWNEFFKSVASKDYSERLNHFLNVEYKNNVIYPSRDNMFNSGLRTLVEQRRDGVEYSTAVHTID